MSTQLTPVTTMQQPFGRDIGFHTDGQLWAVSTTGVLHIWQVDELTKTIDLPGYDNGSLRFNADGSKIHVGAWIVDSSTFQATLALSDMELIQAIIDPGNELRADQIALTHAEWTPDLQKMVLRSNNRPLREIGYDSAFDGASSHLLLFDVASQQLTLLDIESEFIPKNGLATASRWVVVGSEPMTVWDWVNNAPVITFDDVDFCQNAAFNSDESLLASAHNDGTICIWQTSDWSKLMQWQAHDQMIHAVAFHPSQALIASQGDDQQIRLWSMDGAQPQQIAHITSNSLIEGMAFHPAGEQLFVAESPPSPAISIYDLP